MPPPPQLSAFFVFLLYLFSTADSKAQKPGQQVSTQRRVVVLEANATISSKNATFELGFFSPDKGETHFLGICYSSISPPTYIWVANRKNPIKNLTSATLEMTETGRLEIRDAAERSVLWRSENSDTGTEHRVELFETGNLALVSAKGSISWQSFDFPTDTWLPGMNLTAGRGLLSWRSEWDPSPGLYSLRMRPGYGEFELVFNDTEPFWRTGNWTGDSFSNVPEMMIPYIYRFRFDRPYEKTASFGFSERDLNNGLGIQLTRFRVDPSGMFRQFTLSSQTESWNMFWSQPAGTCMVFGTCGEFGICGSEKPCACLSGFEPVNRARWDSGDFSDGCRRRRLNENDGNEGVVCRESDDRFEKVGALRYGSQGNYDNASIGFSSSLGDCKASCLKSCDCVGLYHNDKTNLCRMLNQTLLTLRNLSLHTDSDVELVYIRVPKEAILNEKNNKLKLSPVVLAAIVVGSIAVLGFLALALLFLCRRRLRKMSTGEEDQEEVQPQGEEGQEESVLPLLTLRVFSYKELHNLTNGFSEKLGQGGFGAVFKGELPDSSAVAVKRLERPGGGEKEFRAEVRTIGNIHHLNLVRLRGFCSEDAHRLLVYDYMPNRALSFYLRETGPALSWETRFRVAVGTARGIAYLHEGCRDCIIHCDIKPENILLDGDFNPKVSDFGLAKLLGRDFSRVAATMRGTWGYVAPEWISGVAITAKADVYSYGMTMIELIGGRRNVDSGCGGGGGGEGRGGEKWFFPPWAAGRMIEGDMGAVVDVRLGGDYDAEEARRVGLAAVWCIQDDEAARPTMGTVVKMLEGVVDVVVPPAPKLLQALISGESFRGGVSPDDNRSGGGGGGSETSQDTTTKQSNHCTYLKIGHNKEEDEVAILKASKEEEEEEEEITISYSPNETTSSLSSFNRITRGYDRANNVISGFDGISIADHHDGDDQLLQYAPTTRVGPRDEDDVDGGDYPEIRGFDDAKRVCCLESSKLWEIAGPIAFNIWCNYGINSFTNIFVGHIGDVELSAVAISLSVIANFSFGFLLGMGSALETLCGQAFGAGRVEMLGIYMQRSWIILIGTCIVLSPLYIYSSRILKWLGQENQIAELAGEFTIQIIPQMFSLAVNFPTQKFLQAQSKVSVLAWVGFVALLMHISILYLFIRVLGWGMSGAALAYDISAWGVAVAQVVYIMGWCRESWKGFSWSAFTDIWTFLKLSLASAVMLCLEIWYFMTIIVLTGHLEDPILALGSLSICMNINGWEGMLFIGINAAISVRVSNELGSGHPRAAKYSVIVTCIESLCIGIFFASIVLLTKDHFAIIFTDSMEMKEAVSKLAFLLCITMVLNSVQPVISGVAVGGGWQASVAYINLFCYYIIGLPLGFVLGYKTNLKVEGIWIGMICGTLLQTLILVHIIYKTNWNKEVEQASERLRSWSGQESGSDDVNNL